MKIFSSQNELNDLTILNRLPLSLTSPSPFFSAAQPLMTYRMLLFPKSPPPPPPPQKKKKKKKKTAFFRVDLCESVRKAHGAAHPVVWLPQTSTSQSGRGPSWAP